MTLGLLARIQLWQDLGMSLKAGFRIEDALRHAGKARGPGARLARALAATGRSSLAEAVAAVPGRFTELELAVLEAGETAGRLPETLAGLVEYLKGRRAELTHVLVRLAYPVLIVHLAAFAAAVAPRFAERTSEGGWLVLFLLNLIPFYAITFVLFVLPRLLRASGPLAAQHVDRFLLSAPFVGRFFRAEAENEFYWLMGTLLAAGIPVREAVSFAVRRSSNHAFRQELRVVEEAVLRGDPLGEVLEAQRILPEAATAMVMTAEDTGTLADTFLTLAGEAREKRSLVGQGILGAIWGLYFALAATYVFLALLRFYGGMVTRLDF